MKKQKNNMIKILSVVLGVVVVAAIGLFVSNSEEFQGYLFGTSKYKPTDLLTTTNENNIVLSWKAPRSKTTSANG